jgi:hypothetical protein
MTDRDGYAAACQAARDVLRRANGLELTRRQYRTLNAVIAYTALYSRVCDRVWLDQVAAFAYGVDEARPWMREKIRKDLVVLADKGLITRRAPWGRPPADSSGPAYTIGLRRPESQPDGGLPFEPESQPDGGLPFEPESQPNHVGKPAQSRSESQPDSGGPTEKVTEEVPEKSPAKRPAEAGRRDPDRALAEAIVNPWWERQHPKPQQPWIAVVKVIAKALRGGWTEAELRQALEEVPTVSGSALDFWRRRRTTGTGPSPRTQRNRAAAEAAIAVVTGQPPRRSAS